jgi:hypothetical protein
VTKQERDLEDRLTALFTGPDLDLPQRHDAASVVVTRVRRARRRRRALQVAVPVVLAVPLLAVELSISSFHHQVDQPLRPSESATSGSELPMAAGAVGSLRLGMTVAQAKATGLLDGTGSQVGTAQSPCLSYAGRRGILTVLFDQRGIVQIEVYTFIRTPERIGIGSTYGDLQAAYPTHVPFAPDGRSEYRVPVAGQPGAQYLITVEAAGDSTPPTRLSRITDLALASTDLACT